jgi:hypothetical protein
MVPLFATFIAFMSLGQVPSLNQPAGIVLVSCGLSPLALDELQGLARWPLLLAAASAGATVASYSVVKRVRHETFWHGSVYSLACCPGQLRLPCSNQDSKRTRAMGGIGLSAFAGDRLRPSWPAVVLRVFVGSKPQSGRFGHYDPGK